MENELLQAKEQLKLTGQLSKELASAQREIRELRRANDIQYILRRNNSVPTKLVSESRIAPRENHVPVRAMSVPGGLPAAMNQGENVFSPLSDNVMLKLFSFLDEDSMVAISVTDRVLVRRVNVMFGVTTPSSLANSAPLAAAKQPSPPARKQSKIRSLSFIGSSEKDKVMRYATATICSIFHSRECRACLSSVALEGGCNREILKTGPDQAVPRYVDESEDIRGKL